MTSYTPVLAAYHHDDDRSALVPLLCAYAQQHSRMFTTAFAHAYSRSLVWSRQLWRITSIFHCCLGCSRHLGSSFSLSVKTTLGIWTYRKKHVLCSHVWMQFVNVGLAVVGKRIMLCMPRGGDRRIAPNSFRIVHGRSWLLQVHNMLFKASLVPIEFYTPSL